MTDFKTIKAKRNDHLAFFRHIAERAGIGGGAIQWLKSWHTVNGIQERIRQKLLRTLSQGYSLSESMRMEGSFSGLDCALMQMGETTGDIAKTVKKIVQRIEREEELIKTLWSKFSIPALEIIGAFIAITIIAVYVLPSFQCSLQTMNLHQNPSNLKVSQFVFKAAKLYRENILYVLSAFFLGIIWFWRYCISIPERALIIPIVRNFIVLRAQIIFFLYVSNLVAAGLEMTRIMQLITYSLGLNTITGKMAKRIGWYLDKGFDYDYAMQNIHVNGRHLFYPEIVADITLAKNTGNLETISGKLVEILEKRLEYKIDSVTRWITPVVILGLGIVVALLMLGVYIPQFEVSFSVLKH